MTQETRTLTVPVYRTPDGRPTCAKHFMTGECCRFLRTRTFGTREMCSLSNGVELNRSDDRLGYIIPHSSCPLWNNQ